MDKQVIEIRSDLKIVEIPYEVMVPVFKKVELPEYVLVKEEIVYQVPKIEYEDKTYERPVIIEKEYVIPKYVEKVYEKPIYVEKVYEIPKFVEKIIEVPVVKYIQKEEVNIIKKDVFVTNAIIEDKDVVNAQIRHVTVEALHPKYICGECKKNEVSG